MYLREIYSHDFYGEVEGFIKDEIVMQSVRENIMFEPHIVNAFKTCVSEDSIVVDVGANIGLHSIAISKLFPNLKNIYPFEAHPETFKVLRNNLKKFKKAKIYNIALSNQYSTLGMRSLYGSNNPGGAKVFEISDLQVDFIVKAVPLDQFNFNNKISLIKIDVEGHEMQVIEGSKNIIMKYKPHLIVKIWDLDKPFVRKNKIEEICKLGYDSFPLSEIDFLFKPIR